MRIISVVLETFTPLADTVHSKNKECCALLPKYGVCVFAASVPVLISSFSEILHLFH